MAIYKGIEIDPELAGIMRHMQGVEEYREVLGGLQGAWDTLTLLGQLSGTAAEMSSTREAFQKLTGDLLNHLGRETRAKAISDLRAKAQNAIDILVRNLFERTADIGFLAADDDVREFLKAPTADLAQMQERFREYVAKYSVYSDIVLFAPDGQVRARMGSCEAAFSAHPIIAEAVATTRLYVEYFGAADFLPDGDHLVYAFRVDDSDAVCLGVLALVFRLGDEMQGIFRNLLAEGDWMVLACVTPNGRVIATSSTIQMPVGVDLSRHALAANGNVIRFAGREYLAVACHTHGYQGYMGPGWLGLGLIPLEFAFDRDDSTLLANVDHATLEAVMRHPALFSEALRNIPRQAERIQQDLNRSVWNGSVRQADSSNANAAFSKTLLWEISNAGRKTQAVFEQSIGNLHRTVVAAILQGSLSRAAFAIDVMDRNLYERANDCRWWALNATFRRVLGNELIAPADAARCGDILAYINNLYTVYDNLVLFDARGQAVAVSRPTYSHLIGKSLGEEWVGRTLALTSSQGYVVSEFAPTPLYAGQATHIYAAAVRNSEGTRVVGGIGIVFDAKPQFAAMLADALPRDAGGELIAGSFAVFIDRRSRVISSSEPRFSIGSLFPVHAGSRGTRIIPIDGHYYAVGSVKSCGYREYKVTDGYVHDVVAMSGFPLGEISAANVQKPAPQIAQATRSRRGNAGGDCIEIATFHVGQRWLGVPAGDVIEAIDATCLTPPSGSRSEVVEGFRMLHDKLITVIRLDKVLEDEDAHGEHRQIVVLRTHNKECLGLLVDALGEIPEVPHADIQPVWDMNAAPGMLLSGLVRNLTREGEGDTMLSLLDVGRLCTRLGCHGCEGGASLVCPPALPAA